MDKKDGEKVGLLKDVIFGVKEKITHVTLIHLQSYQCRCMSPRPKDDEDVCPVQIKVLKKTWCGIAPRIDIDCKYRRPPEVNP